MKTLKSNSFIVLSVVLLATLVTFSACNTATSKSTDTTTTVKEEKVKAPSMDIHTAVLMGNLKAVQQHLSAGTDLNVKDQYGSTPLIIAATFGRTEVADLLIKSNANLHTTSADESTPLHTAAFFCRTEIVRLLIDAGADKNLRNKYGSTPLESVLAPFNTVKPIYMQINKDLGPLGIKLDYDELEQTRPVIAELLK